MPMCTFLSNPDRANILRLGFLFAREVCFGPIATERNGKSPLPHAVPRLAPLTARR